MNRQLMRWALTTACLLLGGEVFSNSTAAAQETLAIGGAIIETGTDAGTLRGATLLIRNGKIEAIGENIEIPIAAAELDLSDKWIMPGFIDPYFVVSVGSAPSESTEREVTVGGRTFRVPSSSGPGVPTDFRRIVDSFDPRTQAWNEAVRSGITSLQLVSTGVGESAVARINADAPASFINAAPSHLYLALTNQSAILDVLRRGFEGNQRSGGRTGEASGGDREGRRTFSSRGPRPGGPPPGPTSTTPPSESPTATPAQPQSPQDRLWSDVRDGKKPIFVNVNNAAAILYLASEAKKADKSRIALVANGEDLFQTMKALNNNQVTIVMPPRIDIIPNTRDRVNVARMLNDSKFPLAFSLSLNQNDFRQSQDSPLFAVSMLVRSGLDRQTAVRALTRTPASLLGIAEQVGTIEKGKLGNFVVFDSDPFSGTAVIEQVYVEGSLVYER